MSELQKTKETARATKLSTSFLHHHWKEIDGAYRAGRALRWDVDQVRAWMRRQAEVHANGNGHDG